MDSRRCFSAEFLELFILPDRDVGCTTVMEDNEPEFDAHRRALSLNRERIQGSL